MLLRIVHETRYAYSPPVVMAQHLAHLSPRALPGQAVLSHSLQVHPATGPLTAATDTFGNTRQFFTLQFAHAALNVVADSLVETEAPLPLPDSPSWEDVLDGLRYHAGAPFYAATEFIYVSPYVPHSNVFADYARSVFEPDRPLLEAAEALMTRIHTEMTYASGSTLVNTPALDALAQRKGVCQDFAHIMIGCLRSLGLPARYVSGYLLTHPPEGKPRLIGADASHAWVQVYCPGTAEQPEGIWVDFDPTNNRCGLGRPGEDYITLALGRDFGDVSPLRGVIQGGGTPMLSVAVTVAPPDELTDTPLGTAPATV